MIPGPVNVDDDWGNILTGPSTVLWVEDWCLGTATKEGGATITLRRFGWCLDLSHQRSQRQKDYPQG